MIHSQHTFWVQRFYFDFWCCCNASLVACHIHAIPEKKLLGNLLFFNQAGLIHPPLHLKVFLPNISHTYFLKYMFLCEKISWTILVFDIYVHDILAVVGFERLFWRLFVWHRCYCCSNSKIKYLTSIYLIKIYCL